MTEVVLYHHVQGLTDGVRSFGDELRRAGHTVHTPDMFEGRTFTTIEEGMAFAGEAGFGTLAGRGVAAAEAIGPGVVYAGFSFGVMPAQQLAQTRPGARGAVLMSGCLPVSEFGDAWPEGLPVQVHGKEGDPFFEEDLEAGFGEGGVVDLGEGNRLGRWGSAGERVLGRVMCYQQGGLAGNKGLGGVFNLRGGP